jgi:transketolase
VIALAKETKAIVTIEEHQIIGGMGSIVAQCLSENYPVPIEFIGVLDKFGQTGTTEELRKHYGLDVPSLIKKVELLISRKNKYCH